MSTKLLEPRNTSRRQVLKMFGAGVGLGLTTWQSPVAAAIHSSMKGAGVKNSPKIVWVVLRGALDSLHTIVPTFEPELTTFRPTLASSFNENLLPLDRGFALHPALSTLHRWYQKKQLLPIVAVSSGYDQRSHFDGQDFLESGKPHIDFNSGWLARAIDQKDKKALAVARSIPVSLRSSSAVDTWYPTRLKSSEEELHHGLMSLYQNNPALLQGLQKGLGIREMAGQADDVNKKSGFIDLTKACAQLLSGDKGVDCAMLELGGWDTHNNQAKRLNKKLAELDAGLAKLQEHLAEQWQNTTVVIATEFGRTVKENGTGGTDHGTASALFLAGGAVAGGKVLGEWPGLKKQQLFEQRDLAATSNSFTWLAGILQQHWQLSDEALKAVFPEIKPQKTPLIKQPVAV